jgi:hypothetical protein
MMPPAASGTAEAGEAGMARELPPRHNRNDNGRAANRSDAEMHRFFCTFRRLAGRLRRLRRMAQC